jgi:hypothetical protein
VVIQSKDDWHEVVGAIHLHSNYSDGSLSIPEIARIAGEKNLDFLMFSDHNTLEPKWLGLEGWYGNILVFIGCEINDPDDRNHYLAFGVDREVKKGSTAPEYVHEVRQMGGFGIIAHPAEKRSFSDAYPPYPWTAWEVNEYDGIEIWNQLSEWMEGITRANILWRMVHPLRSIRYPAWETLERWDRANQKRCVVGIGGIDVHGYVLKILGFIPKEIYPYKVQFRSIRTHFLVEKSIDTKMPFREAEKLIFEAMSRARCFVTNASLGDGRGFRFCAMCGNQTYPMGSRISPDNRIVFNVTAPLPGFIRLMKDGREVASRKGKELEYTTTEKGVYRVEIFRKNRGWIYSNPIVILKSIHS